MKKKVETTFHLTKPLAHVAFIMDGNGRWAKKRFLPRHLGHKEGCKRIIEIFDVCKEFDIHVMSLYAFSTENWKRPQDEIQHLFEYLEEFFHREIDHLMRDGVQVRTMGDLSRLPTTTQEVIQEAKEKTKDNQNYIFNICLNYGGRDEIIRGFHRYLESESKEELTENTFGNYLDSHDLPDVDLLIRTSGEQRISNFMLWELAYAEMIFTKTYWPDFKRKQFIECLEEYQARDRRYGGLTDGKDASK